MKTLLTAAAVLCVGLLLLSRPGLAGTKDNPDIKGWEKGGAYDKRFDAKEIDSIKGRVSKIVDITPMPGMAPGIGLVIEDKKDKSLETVHLGPKDAVDIAVIGLKEGDQVKVIGAWAEFEGHDVMLAVKVKKDENVQLKVRRTKDGFPFWSMTPEERKREETGE